jgi:tetratricopeptide (TPR) repeat protein
MNWLIFAALTLIFAYTPFKRGLFFSSDQYLYSCVLCLGCAAWLIFHVIRKKKVISTSYLWIFSLPFMYFLTFTVAESPNNNFDSLLSWMAYLSFFVLLLDTRNTRKIEVLMPYLFSLVGTMIAYFSLFGVWKWIHYKDIIYAGRTAGPFQYANTFAAVIGAYWIFTLVILSKKHKSWYASCLLSLPLVAYGIGFLHSYSRGAFLVLPLVWLIGLFFMRLKEQLIYLFYTVISVAGSLIVFRVMVLQEQNQTRNPGLLAFIITTLVIMGAGILIEYARRRGIWGKASLRLSNSASYFRFVVPGLAILIGILTWIDLQNQGMIFRQLPISLQDRFQNIGTETGSALARTNMYEDAWKMSKDAPLLGLGGDGWKTLYTHYQTSPYWSNEIHNGYLEVLLNTGWLGLLLFLVIFIFLFVQLIHRIRREHENEHRSLNLGVLLALLVLFLHAAIDFDFSYGSVWFTIFWLLSMGLPERPTWPVNVKVQTANWMSAKQKAAMGGILQCILIFGVLTGGVYALRFYLAASSLPAAGQSIDVNEGVRIFTSAKSKNPYNVDHWIGLANVRAYQYRNTMDDQDRRKVMDALAHAENLEPRNPATLFKISSIFAEMNEYDQAIEYLDKAIMLDPFNVFYYDERFKNKYLKLTQQAASSEGQQSASEIASSIARDYEEYMRWFRQWESVNVPDKRPIAINGQSYIIVGEAYRLLQKYRDALEVLNSQITIDSRLMDSSQDRPLNKPFRLLSMADVINQYSKDIVILSVKDEAAKHLSENSKRVLEQLGSHVSELGERGSYVSILSEGKVAFEQINNEGSVEVNSKTAPDLAEMFAHQSFSIYSAGLFTGNRSSIRVNGKEYSKNERGVNIAVFDLNMNPIGTFQFDTHVSDLKAVPLED